MSELHSETNNKALGLSIRIKLVDLNHTGSRVLAERAKECLGAAIGLKSEHFNHDKPKRPFVTDAKLQKPNVSRSPELCMLNGERISSVDFETHIETCSICANRVELQLDFMESLEAAIYQRKADLNGVKTRGAMLISAPELNFAVCGELEIG